MGKTRSLQEGNPKTLAVWAAAIVLLSGCQCGPLYEGYARFVDGVSDQLPLVERFYIPQLDISRIGQPDWCQSPINRLLAPCECRGDVPQPAVTGDTPQTTATARAAGAGDEPAGRTEWGD